MLNFFKRKKSLKNFLKENSCNGLNHLFLYNEDGENIFMGAIDNNFADSSSIKKMKVLESDVEKMIDTQFNRNVVKMAVVVSQ